MNLEQLDKALDHIEQQARHIFANNGKLVPVFFVFGNRMPDGTKLPDGERGMFIAPWQHLCSDPDDKDAVRDAQQQMVKTLDAEAVAFVMEAWAVVVDDEERKQNADRFPPLSCAPSKHPQRFEIVNLRAECPDGTLDRMIPIERPKQGPAKLGETRKTSLDRSESILAGETCRFAGYFPPAQRGEA
jgi:hypothetical protein